MAEPVVKRDLRELMGISVNASTLTLQRAHQETPLTRIAAMGAAALAVHHSADIQKVPIAGAASLVYGKPLDPRDVLAGELVPMLWHIRYGRQHDLVPKAVALFAAWIAYRAHFAEYAQPEHQALRLAFSARAMHEWLSDKCPVCGGTKKQERSRSGRWVRPRGSMQRNATFRPCVACSGTGRASIRHPERMKDLGLTREQYEGQHWQQRFNAGLKWLTELLPSRLMRSLTSQLERRKTRS